MILKKGSRGEQVKQLQKKLNLVADGVFGTLTEEVVKAFQAEHKLVVDGVVGDKTWNEVLKCSNVSAHEFQGLYKKSKRNIKRIILHCSATPEGKDFGVSDIKRWHTAPTPKGRGWSDVGYHYIIKLDGTVQLGRDVDLVGAHTTGYNTTSIGICYIGGLDSAGKTKDTRTLKQKAAIYSILSDLKKLYPKATIHGHYEFANKDCPSFKVDEYKGI